MHHWMKSAVKAKCAPLVKRVLTHWNMHWICHRPLYCILSSLWTSGRPLRRPLMWIRILNHIPCPKTSWFLLFHHHQSHFKHSSPERLGSTSLPPKAVSPYPLHVIHKGLQPDEDQCPFSLRQQTQELNISQKKVHYFVKSDISRQVKTLFSLIGAVDPEHSW